MAGRRDSIAMMVERHESFKKVGELNSKWVKTDSFKGPKESFKGVKRGGSNGGILTTREEAKEKRRRWLGRQQSTDRSRVRKLDNLEKFHFSKQ